ncbi:MAG: hypothetical protein JXA69_08605 [Phycisphaerae bacterium]|nr:hypothetical protein [Phycisphaerae bacterium]
MSELAIVNASAVQFAHELETFEAKAPAWLAELDGIDDAKATRLRRLIPRIISRGHAKLRDLRRRYVYVRPVLVAADLLGVEVGPLLDACFVAIRDGSGGGFVEVVEALGRMVPGADAERVAEAAWLVMDAALRLPEEPSQ